MSGCSLRGCRSGSSVLRPCLDSTMRPWFTAGVVMRLWTKKVSFYVGGCVLRCARAIELFSWRRLIAVCGERTISRVRIQTRNDIHNNMDFFFFICQPNIKISTLVVHDISLPEPRNGARECIGMDTMRRYPSKRFPIVHRLVADKSCSFNH